MTQSSFHTSNEQAIQDYKNRIIQKNIRMAQTLSIKKRRADIDRDILDWIKTKEQNSKEF